MDNRLSPGPSVFHDTVFFPAKTLLSAAVASPALYKGYLIELMLAPGAEACRQQLKTLVPQGWTISLHIMTSSLFPHQAAVLKRSVGSLCPGRPPVQQHAASPFPALSST